ncbi:MAG: 50S ribosomal protein L23 [Candidatus Peribacteraceae bacterium]|nr:50S ribosomal protein L23 [Candidatus Peribacteraceae bacterium]
MDLSRVIIAPVVTEKAERLKAGGSPASAKATAGRHVYTLRVAPTATKIDVKNALKIFYDVDVTQVRIIKTQAKRRNLGAGKIMEKRHSFKKAMVTLSEKSKALDISAFQVISS